MLRIQFKIARQTPPDPPTWKTYELQMQPGNTILDALNAIKWEQDGSLAFRKNCRNTICGSCTMRINGRAALACQISLGQEIERLQTQPQPWSSDLTNSRHFLTSPTDQYPEDTHSLEPMRLTQSADHAPLQIILEPMGNFPIIKDLVVEMDQFWHHLAAIQPSLKGIQPAPDDEYYQTPQNRSLLDQVENCILCGACYSDCNARDLNPQFVGPHALAKAYRLIADSRDQNTTERLEALNNAEYGVWGCTRCLNCNQVCPMDVQPLDRITDIKQQILAEADDQASRAIRHRKVLVELVKQDGWVDERQFGLKVVSNSLRDWQGLWSLGPLGLRMMLSGKFPWHFQPSLGVETVRSLIQAVETATATDHHATDATAPITPPGENRQS